PGVFEISPSPGSAMTIHPMFVATLLPNSPDGIGVGDTIFCNWCQVPPSRLKTYTAPESLAAPGAPTIRYSPSNATEEPKNALSWGSSACSRVTKCHARDG